MDVTFFKLDKTSHTSNVELPINHMSNINVGYGKDYYCAFCCNLVLFSPPEASFSLTSSYVQHFNTINKNGIIFDYGLQIEDLHKFRKVKYVFNTRL